MFLGAHCLIFYKLENSSLVQYYLSNIYVSRDFYPLLNSKTLPILNLTFCSEKRGTRPLGGSPLISTAGTDPEIITILRRKRIQELTIDVLYPSSHTIELLVQDLIQRI